MCGRGGVAAAPLSVSLFFGQPNYACVVGEGEACDHEFFMVHVCQWHATSIVLYTVIPCLYTIEKFKFLVKCFVCERDQL